MEPLSPYGTPESVDLVCDDLAALPTEIKAAWHTAQAHPDQAEEILASLVHSVQNKSRITRLHLRGAVQRGQRKDDAYAKARAAAEKRIQTALARNQAEAIGDAFDPHGWFVYLLWGTDPARPVYIGQSRNILARLGSHLANPERRRLVQRVSLIRCKGAAEMTKTEMRLIAHYRPMLNIVGNLRDDEIGSEQVK